MLLVSWYEPQKYCIGPSSNNSSDYQASNSITYWFPGPCSSCYPVRSRIEFQRSLKFTFTRSWNAVRSKSSIKFTEPIPVPQIVFLDTPPRWEFKIRHDLSKMQTIPSLILLQQHRNSPSQAFEIPYGCFPFLKIFEVPRSCSKLASLGLEPATCYNRHEPVLNGLFFCEQREYLLISSRRWSISKFWK